jgi:hypothetical protein
MAVLILRLVRAGLLKAGLELRVRFMPTYVELRSCFGIDSEFCGDSRVG